MKKEYKNKGLSSNIQEYLVVITDLKEKEGLVRITKISEVMDMAKSSVNNAIKTLKKEGYTIHERYGYVNVTAKVSRVA
jgi:DtxR family Mn-dependent transcriptional regulator